MPDRVFRFDAFQPTCQNAAAGGSNCAVGAESLATQTTEKKAVDISHHHHDGKTHDLEGHHHGPHHHHHHHQHHAAPDSGNRAFMLAIVLNIGFVIAEFAYGFIAQSTALMADAGHNLSDVLGLALAWGAALLSKRQPAGRYTYGLRSTSILAALANAMLLMVACGAIALEAARRLVEPAEVGGLMVSAVAAVGIVVNGLSAWLFMAGSKHDLNIRGAFLHMAADAAVSLAVVIGGLAMLATRQYWIDPALSLLIVAVILIGTWGLLRDALRLSLSAVPAHIDLLQVQCFLAEQPGVAQVHDLHIWGMSTTESALTAQLIMPDGHPGDDFMQRMCGELEARFRIHHSTLEIRHRALPVACALERTGAT
jgi:cobalt-zinc-cadmium efflux system protein